MSTMRHRGFTSKEVAEVLRMTQTLAQVSFGVKIDAHEQKRRNADLGEAHPGREWSGYSEGR